MFTDSVLRYFGARHGIMWPGFKGLRKPLRFYETVVLPVTGFSPGADHSGAGDLKDEEAMVYHAFRGSWKGGS